jgi:acetyl esterase/lipase
MPASFPDFTAAELAEARRINRSLAYMPRFRAPTPMGRMMIQSMLRTSQALASHGVRKITISTRQIRWRDHDVTLRILRPSGPVRGVYIDYHGGGWSIGNAVMDDYVNARIARDCELAVVSVDYAMLPDIEFTAMIDQCAAAAEWIFQHAEAEFDAAHLFIGGESAGAHLAACTLVRMRDVRSDFARVRGAVLFYGPYDLSGTPSVRSAPRETLVLDGPAMTPGIAKLLPGRSEEERRHAAFSPLYADLAGLPPALLLCGTIDPLIDDSRMMAERWDNAELVIVPEAPHAFNRLPTRLAKRTNAFVRAWVNERLTAGLASQSIAAE